MRFRAECKMIVTVVKTIEADSYEEAENKARMLNVPSAWCDPDESWDTNETTFGCTPEIDLDELSVTAISEER